MDFETNVVDKKTDEMDTKIMMKINGSKILVRMLVYPFRESMRIGLQSRVCLGDGIG